MSDDDHDHSEMSEVALRVRALETILVEKGYVDPAALDAIVETYETRSARATARASWRKRLERSRLPRAPAAPTRRRRSPNSATAAGRANIWSRVENTPARAQSRRLHIVLLLSLAGARPAARLVQVAALSLARRHRSARRARRIRRRRCRGDAEIRVWDSTAEVRYLVVPMRPERTRETGARSASPRSSRATA